MVHEPASHALHEHLRQMAIRLGAADPTEDLAEAIVSGFERPLDDEAYGDNALQPGALPFEWSFSEAACGSVRVDFEPSGPHAPAVDRQADATRLVRNMIRRRGGETDLVAFDRASEPWRHGAPHLRFGAFLGASIGPRGLDEAKVYYEMERWNMEAMSPRTRDVVDVARASISGLSPLLCSVSWNRDRVIERVYMVCRDDLRLLDLTECLQAADLGHRAPDLMFIARALGGGTLVLPGGTTVLSFRETPGGLEMKLEIVAPTHPLRQHAIRRDIPTLLRQRPESLRAFDRWLAAVAPDQGGTISVSSIGISPHTSSRLSAYVRLTAGELAGACVGALPS